jgi:hypothetical protein
VARLAEPLTRVEERFWWFCETPPKSDEASFDAPATAAAAHDDALVHLYRGLLTNAATDDLQTWQYVMQYFDGLAASDGYLAWLVEAETGGDFEKRASLDEIAIAQKGMAARLSGPLVGAIEQALERDDFAAAAQVVRLVPAGRAADGMLDRMEDDLVGRCGHIAERIAAAWKTRQVNFLRPACNHAIARFHSTVGPLIDHMVSVTDDVDRHGRIRSHGVQLLILTSEGYEAIYDFLASQRTLTTALPLAEGTPTEPVVRDLLEKVDAAAKRQRQGAPALHRQSPAKSTYQPKGGTYRSSSTSSGFEGWGRLGWVAIVLISAIARFAATSSSPSSNYNSTPYYNPGTGMSRQSVGSGGSYSNDQNEIQRRYLDALIANGNKSNNGRPNSTPGPNRPNPSSPGGGARSPGPSSPSPGFPR